LMVIRRAKERIPREFQERTTVLGNAVVVDVGEVGGEKRVARQDNSVRPRLSSTD
jgi:hypothetical protein